MHPTYLRLVALIALAFSATLLAADAEREPIPPPPPPPEERRTSPPGGGAFEPEITITTKGTEIHEEYRYNGVLYRVKVTPRYGPPYYLIYDEHGTMRRSDLEPNIVVPQWVIKRF